jgi:diguanylate cyclase (GGDEF)-like protein/PAS domain S-box-containing protein
MDVLDSKHYSMLQQIFANLSVAAFAIDKNYKVILWNRACEELTGLLSSEIIGTRDHWRGFYKNPRSCLADTLLSEGLEDALKIYPYVSESKAVDGGLHAENWCVNKEGEKIYLLFEAGKIIGDDGEVFAVVETLRDTTQPKLLNDIQQASSAIIDFSINANSLEELLKNTMDLVHASPWLTVVNKGSIHLIDKDYPEQLLLRYSKGLPTNIQNLCQVITMGHCLCGQAANTGKILFSNSNDKANDSSCSTADNLGQYCVPIQSHSNILGVINTYTPAGHQATPGERAFLENISQSLANAIERWEAEQEIREAKASLSKAEKMSKMGSWTWFVQENRLRLSDEAIRLLEISKDLRDLSVEDLLVKLPTETRDWVQKTISEHTKSDDSNFATEHIVIRPDGSERVIKEEYEVERNDEGKLVQIIGTMLDITQRRKAIEVTQLLGRVLGGSMNAIYIFDSRSLKLIQVSEGARKMVGYSYSELAEMTMMDLAQDLDLGEFVKYLEALLNHEQERVVFETVIMTKNSESRPVEVSMQLSHAEQPPVFVAITTSISKRLEEKKELQRLAHYDALTGLPNRILFNERLEQAIAQCKRKGTTMALMFMDLDKFKIVNDTMGHDAGDMLLKEAASRISGCLRETDTVARMGGDEFTVILGETASHDEAAIVAKKIIEQISTSFNIGNNCANIGTSIGISIYPDNGEDSVTLIKRADIAMYAVKQSGRNNLLYFDQAMDSDII